MSQFAKEVVGILLLLAWMKIAGGKERNEMLTIVPGQRFSNDVRGKYEAGQFHSKVECTARLLQIATSSSAMFCRNNNSCFTSSHPSDLTTNSTEDDADCEIIYSNNISGGWKYVFGAKKGTGVRLYDAWDDAKYNCTDEHCNDIYKSEIVNNWDTSNITKVLVVLFDKMAVGAWLEFDGKGSGKDNWFSESRLYDSSWSDLVTSSHNKFDQKANWYTPHRFFYISHQWGGCINELLWICVSEDVLTFIMCRFDMHSSYPQFVYSSSDYMKGENELALADWFTVYIKQGQ